MSSDLSIMRIIDLSSHRSLNRMISPNLERRLFNTQELNDSLILRVVLSVNKHLRSIFVKQKK